MPYRFQRSMDHLAPSSSGFCCHLYHPPSVPFSPDLAFTHFWVAKGAAFGSFDLRLPGCIYAITTQCLYSRMHFPCVKITTFLFLVCYTQACLCLLRHYRRKSIKSLRFDNPVYRTKCEEDQFTLSMARHHAASALPPSVSGIL